MGKGLRATALVGTIVMAAASVVAQRRPSFVSDVAPILHAQCTTCHQPDSAAPFALLSYDDAKTHAKEIRAAVSSRQMPPWSAVAASGYPALLHDRRLTAKQIDTIVSWVDAGMPPGDLTRAPMPPVLPSAWQLGLPDLTISLPRAVSLPADTAPQVFNVVLYLNFPADRWIRAIDYRPSSRGLLTHAVLFAVPSTMVVGDEDPLPGYAGLMGAAPGTNPGEELMRVDHSIETIGVWTPVVRIWPAPDGTAVRLPKGTNLVMQFHARPSDTGAFEDGTAAIYFANTAPATMLTTLQVPSSLGIAAGIDIPASESNTTVRDEFVLPVDVTAMGARAHAHALGKELKLTARLPNGAPRGLLWVDRWNPQWQESYYFVSPVRLPKGTRLQVEITYAPSARRVGWGPRLSDEVGAMDLIIVTPPAGDVATLADARVARFREQLLKVR